MLSGIVGDSGLLMRSRTRLEPFDSTRAKRGVLSSVSRFASSAILVDFWLKSGQLLLTFGSNVGSIVALEYLCKVIRKTTSFQHYYHTINTWWTFRAASFVSRVQRQTAPPELPIPSPFPRLRAHFSRAHTWENKIKNESDHARGLICTVGLSTSTEFRAKNYDRYIGNRHCELAVREFWHIFWSSAPWSNCTCERFTILVSAFSLIQTSLRLLLQCRKAACDDGSLTEACHLQGVSLTTCTTRVSEPSQWEGRGGRLRRDFASTVNLALFLTSPRPRRRNRKNEHSLPRCKRHSILLTFFWQIHYWPRHGTTRNHVSHSTRVGFLFHLCACVRVLTRAEYFPVRSTNFGVLWLMLLTLYCGEDGRMVRCPLSCGKSNNR